MHEVTYSISIYLCLYPHFATDYDNELQESIVQWIIGNFGEIFYKDSFELNVILDFLARMMDKFGMNLFNTMISKIPEDTLM
jgi:hypothetical protein